MHSPKSKRCTVSQHEVCVFCWCLFVVLLCEWFQRIAVTNSVLLVRLAQSLSPETQQLDAGTRIECDWTASLVFPVFGVKK